MYELTDQKMRMITGGGPMKYIIYALFGAAFYRLWRSKRGRISLPKVITIEWGND